MREPKPIKPYRYPDVFDLALILAIYLGIPATIVGLCWLLSLVG